jgi:hypothetical protein
MAAFPVASDPQRSAPPVGRKQTRSPASSALSSPPGEGIPPGGPDSTTADQGPGSGSAPDTVDSAGIDPAGIDEIAPDVDAALVGVSDALLADPANGAAQAELNRAKTRAVAR